MAGTGTRAEATRPRLNVTVDRRQPPDSPATLAAPRPPLLGTLGDRIGRRRLLMIGAVTFGLAALLAAYATSPQMLITARALMGLAGAMMLPSTLSLIANMFQDPVQRAHAIGIWGQQLLRRDRLGPAGGRWLAGVFWWGSVFLINVLVMAWYC